jgi:hypothetical protein
MDVERIQKVNNLALDLMRQGLADNRDDAIVQAEKIYDGKDTEEYSSMKETMEKVKEDHRAYIGESSQETNEDLSQEKVKDILEQNTKFIVKRFKEMQEKIEKLEKEMIDLGRRVTTGPTVREIVSNVPPISVPKPEVESNTQPEVQEPQQQQEPQVQQQEAAPVQEQKQEQNTSHPRSGNYNADDVSIEKIFYMGNK